MSHGPSQASHPFSVEVCDLGMSLSTQGGGQKAWEGTMLTILSLQLGSMAGEFTETTLGLLSLVALLIHLVFQGPAHLLHVSL